VITRLACIHSPREVIVASDEQLARIEQQLNGLRRQMATLRGCLYGLSGFILGAAIVWMVGWGTTPTWVAVSCGLLVGLLGWVIGRSPGLFPEELQEARQQAEQERRERLSGVPAACPVCGATIPTGATKCPRCG
jgi:hypothetical protein